MNSSILETMDIIFFMSAILSAIVHIYIFVLETFLWTSKAAMKIFDLSEKEAASTKELAANQGVYNGALAGLVIAGIIGYVLGYDVAGSVLILSGVSVMAVAASYLFFSSSDKREAATKQAIFPLLTIIAAIAMFA